MHQETDGLLHWTGIMVLLFKQSLFSSLFTLLDGLDSDYIGEEQNGLSIAFVPTTWP